jgi:hypothetical protein
MRPEKSIPQMQMHARVSDQLRNSLVAAKRGPTLTKPITGKKLQFVSTHANGKNRKQYKQENS